MDWFTYFNVVKDIKAFETALNTKGDYTQENPIISSKHCNEKPANLPFHYNKRTGNLFNVNTGENCFIIDKFYLMKFLIDFVNRKKIIADNSDVHYVSFEFMLELYLSRDTLSGLPQYNRYLNQLIDTLEQTSLNFEGKKVVSTIDELENHLKNSLLNFNSLKSELNKK
jgi:hypothetical protein